MSYNEYVGEKLNALLQKNIEAKQGFLKAAEKMENPAIQSFFNNKARERKDFARQLEAYLNQLNIESKEEDSIKSKVHRTWMDIRTLVSSDQEEAVLEEVIRGENAILEKYREILDNESVPSTTRNFLNAQMNKIETGLEIVEKMEAVR